MKNFLIIIFLLSVLGITLIYNKKIATYIIDNFIYRKTIVINEPNEYKRNYDFLYVQQTNDFYPKNIQDVYNIFYTILNNGWTNFAFFCDDSYTSCLTDIDNLTKNSDILSDINNFVPVFNTFDKISVYTNNFGKINVDVTYAYNETEINAINKKLDEFIKNNIKDYMQVEDKIRLFHDYVVENAEYDTERAELIEQHLDDSNSLYESHIAYGPLLQGYAICGGYSDAMALFLDRIGVINYKIATDNHIWNLVKINDKWYHLDLTWDDPVLSNGENIIMHNFFMITTEELEEINTGQHDYPKNIYLEAQ